VRKLACAMHCPSAMKLCGIRHPFVMCTALKFLYQRCNTPCTITASYTLQSTEKRASSFSHSRKDPRGSRRLIRCGQQHVRHSIRQWYRSTRSAIMKTYDGCQLHFPIAHAHLERSCRAANIVSCQCIWHSIVSESFWTRPSPLPISSVDSTVLPLHRSLASHVSASLPLSHAWCEVGRRAGPE
jgi:hypothetical protein